MIGTYYDNVFAAAQERGLPVETAADHAASALLDGKPARQGKRKWSGTDRLAEFWASSFLRALPEDAWQQESLGLVLTCERLSVSA
ncbi:hypothetical protein [Hydrogenophaga sp.]|uniref:hypothetical protein n=1 Tax=Hydrogenophaga sp. TaxID=1904254 RepID=UPI002730435C|nr:hypothetical protein [Hydrogenophaga sp.]MDP2073405.1 hypothetical protein [Hydrogenophaga sp.]MDP3106793.1 hypothetical protein [Hydrogenophaga sp.]